MSTAVESNAVTVRSDTVREVRAEDLEQHRRELTGYCYRMLGSSFEAEDAVQETMVRAWRAFERLRGPLDAALVALPHRHQRVPRHAAEPPAPGPPHGHGAVGDGRRLHAATTLPESAWIEPIPDDRVLPEDGDPGRAGRGAGDHPPGLRHRPPAPPGPPARRADPARGAALAGDRGGRAARHHRGLGQQRPPAGPGHARPARARRPRARRGRRRPAGALARYVDAFERYDITSLVALLHDDAVMSMPPYDFWLRGPVEMGRWFLGQGAGCRGSRLVATAANGCAAFGSYRVDPEAATRRGPSRSSRSQVTGSSGTTTSSTPRSSPPSAFPHTSTTDPLSGTTSRRPTRSRSSTTSGPG